MKAEIEKLRGVITVCPTCERLMTQRGSKGGFDLLIKARS